MPLVQFTGAVRSAVGEAASLEIEATTIKELLRKLVERHPKLQPHIDEGLSLIHI